MKNKFGIIGLVVGLIAVGLAIFQDDLRSAEPPPPPKPDPSLKELAVEAGKKVIKEKVLKQEHEQAGQREHLNDQVVQKRDGVQLVYTGLGLLAMILGIVSWIRKDHIRISGGAVSLGLMAVAWEFVLIGVCIAVAIFVLANLAA